MNIYNLLTPTQIAFIQEIDDFCQKIFGFPVGKYLAYSERWLYERELYLVAVCPRYQLWPANTPMNKFYVYLGNSEITANEIAEHYQKEGHDLYIRNGLTSYTSAPGKPIIIIPSFFEGMNLSSTEIDTFKLDGIQILLHEAFHAHVHRYDIGLENYGNYLTIQEMAEKETIATFISWLSQIEFLLYKKCNNECFMTAALNGFGQLANYYYLDDDYKKLNKIYNNKKLSVRQKEKRKQIILQYGQNNNASLLLNHLYYGNSFTRKYFGILKKDNGKDMMKRIIQQFVKAYWEKHRQ